MRLSVWIPKAVCVFPKPIHLSNSILGTGAMAQTELIISPFWNFMFRGWGTDNPKNKLMHAVLNAGKNKPGDAEVRGARSLRLRVCVCRVVYVPCGAR